MQAQVLAPDCSCSSAFPNEAVDDYAPEGCFVRIGIPEDPNQGKLLIKGSELMTSYRIDSESWHTLLPPNYTAIELTGADKIIVEFKNIDGSRLRKFWVTPVNKNNIEQASTNFSMLFYGCTEPFETDKYNQAIVSDNKRKINYYMRNFFARTALQESMNYWDISRIPGEKTVGPQSRPIIFTDKTHFARHFLGSALQVPKIVIGNGDMIYTDAGYGHNASPGLTHPIMAWSVGVWPRPCLSVDDFRRHLNLLHLHGGSFASFDTMFSKVPLCGIWDDHDIRDGWGSQGDEYTPQNGIWTLAAPLRPFYLSARRAYIDHFYSLYQNPGGNVNTLVNSNDDLHQEITVGGKRCFIFDLRSNRNSRENRVISDAQMQAFFQWVDNLNDGEEVVIVSSIPLFFSYMENMRNIYKTLNAEIKDDICDAWDSPNNVGQRDEIISKLLTARIRKHIRPYVVSGDVHSGAIMELFYAPFNVYSVGALDHAREQRQVFAYELITTGLTHETISDGVTLSNYFQHATEGARQSEWIKETFSVDGQEYKVQVIIHISDPKLNFGALNFKDGITSLNLFLLRVDKYYKNRMVVSQNIVNADWSKGDNDEKKWEYQSARQRVRSVSSGNYLYTAAPVNTIRRFFIDENFPVVKTIP
jgi:hypothetical protein